MALILRPCLCSALILTMVSASMGCTPTVARLAKGEKGVDVSSIQPDVTRANAEAILGPPVRGWTSPTGIRYATYTYDAGVPPNMKKATAFAVFNLMFFFLPEIVEPQRKNPLWYPTHIVERVAISYDDRDVILGIFDEFDDLPPDGRSGPRRWGRPPPESEK